MCYVPAGTLRDSKLRIHLCQRKSELAVEPVNLAKKSETFWDRLQEAFHQANAPTIARKLDVEKQTVYKWRDGTLPSLDRLLAISRSTGYSLHWLVTGEGARLVNSGPAEIPEKSDRRLSERDRELVNSLIEALKRGVESR